MIKSSNFLEHRWLHQIKDSDILKKKINKTRFSNLLTTGKDVTIISMSYLTLEAIKANKLLKKYNINSDVIDLVSLKPLNYEPIFKSIKKQKE